MHNNFNTVDLKTPSSFLNEITFEELASDLKETSEKAAAPEVKTETPAGDNPAANQGGFNPGQPGSAPFNVGGQTNVIAAQFINGKTAVALTDIIVPLLLTYLLMTFVKKKVRRSTFQLNAEEKKTLEPILDACLQTLNINFNSPWIALAVVGSTIYGAKFIEVASDETIPKIEVSKERGLTVEKKKDGRGRPRKQV